MISHLWANHTNSYCFSLLANYSIYSNMSISLANCIKQLLLANYGELGLL